MTPQDESLSWYNLTSFESPSGPTTNINVAPESTVSQGFIFRHAPVMFDDDS